MSDGWQGCPLVNPYCPNDLCVYPANGHRKHRLGTDGGDDHHIVKKTHPNSPRKQPWGALFMAPEGTSEIELILLGSQVSEELWPEHYEGTGR